MIAAIATIAFLAAALLALIAIAGSLEDSLAKVAAALSGRAPHPEHQSALRLSPRHLAARPARARARPTLRAAA